MRILLPGKLQHFKAVLQGALQEFTQFKGAILMTVLAYTISIIAIPILDLPWVFLEISMGVSVAGVALVFGLNTLLGPLSLPGRFIKRDSSESFVRIRNAKPKPLSSVFVEQVLEVLAVSLGVSWLLWHALFSGTYSFASAVWVIVVAGLLLGVSCILVMTLWIPALSQIHRLHEPSGIAAPLGRPWFLQFLGAGAIVLVLLRVIDVSLETDIL